MRNASTWKAIERRVALELGGVRRGAHTSNGGAAGHNDVIHPTLSIEVKHRSVPSYTDCHEAVEQARASASNGQIPIAVVHRKGQKITLALVCMTLEDFKRLVPAEA